jgi:hypothetical protein
MVAGVPTLLAVPSPVAPEEIPEPLLEPRALDRQAQDDQALAEAAERDRLDTDVRAVGSAYRAFCLVELTRDPAEIARARRDLTDAVQRAAPQGDAALAKLRAYELRSFLRELRRWELTGEETDELRELGGPFLDRARTNGWIAHGHLIADDTVRTALFKKRWIELTLARGPVLELGRMESRALYRFLILHPPRDASFGSGNAAAERAAHDAERYRLRKIDELAAVDPSYPAELAKGVVYYRLHEYTRSVESFRHFLEDHPDGPYKLRAQNHLRAALARAMDLP